MATFRQTTARVVDHPNGGAPIDAARLPAEGITPSGLSTPSGVAVRLPQPMRSVASRPDGLHLRGPDRGQGRRRTVRGWEGGVPVASRFSATSSLKWLAVLIPLADRLLQCLPPSTGGVPRTVIRGGEQKHLSLRHGSAAITAEGHHLENFPPTLGTWNPGFLLNVSFFYPTLCGDPPREIEVSRCRRATSLGQLSPNPPKGYGGGVDTGDDGYGKANGPGPVPIDGVEGSARWPRQWPGGGRQWRRPAKTARRHAGSGTGGLGWHEFAGQPLGLSGGRVGRRRRAVRLVGEWRAIGPGRN